ncbi:MAG: hypothetical protein KME26_31205 [Oscillatoria princeps RMCB-10]|nr:hypothetical protein [Oscillatoria princeps RMCB-10]
MAIAAACRAPASAGKSSITPQMPSVKCNACGGAGKTPACHHPIPHPLPPPRKISDRER